MPVSYTHLMLRQLIVILPAAYLLSQLGLPQVWYAFPIAEGFSLLASILLYLRLYRRELRGLEKKQEVLTET